MDRRDFLRLGGAAMIGPSLPSVPAWADTANAATVLYDDRSVVLRSTGTDPGKAKDALWVLKSDVPRVNGFEIKPQGACRADVCIPLSKDLTRGQYFNLTGFAKKIGESVVVDADSRVWSFGEIAAYQSGLLSSRVAPDFAVPDRKGRFVRLSDFRGKKVLVFTWASWCGCRQDLPGWQKLYEELKGKNFEIIAAAEDTAGEAVAGHWYDVAKLSFTTLIDATHGVSSAFQFMNVPSGVWIDEQGRVVRPAEPAWNSDRKYSYGEKAVVTQGELYVTALRDWVSKGERSEYALSDREFTARVKPRSVTAMEAEASFKLGVWFQRAGQNDRATRYFQRAQQLNPDDWNYFRQQWSFDPKDGGKWMEKFQKLDEPYYPKLKITSKDDTAR